MGVGIGAIEALAVGHGRVQRDRMAGDGGRRRELFVCVSGGRFLAGYVDDTRDRRDDVSGGVRVVDWIYGLHLLAGTRPDLEGVDIRVCESCDRGFSGL